MTIRTLIVLACAAVAAAPAHAALTIQECPNYPPTLARCSSDAWVTSICGVYWNASDPAGPCGPILAQAGADYQAQSQTGPSSERVFDSSVNDFIASQPPPIKPLMAFRTGTQATWANQEEKARYVAAHSNAWLPLLYQRDPSYTFTAAANSCEAYVYKSFYDVERWIDGMNACKNDTRCIVINSLWGMTATGPAAKPGIARRWMSDIESQPISARIADLAAQGKVSASEKEPFAPNYALPDELPKNQFYANTQSFLPPAILKAFTAAGQGPQVQALIDEIERGRFLYRTGVGTPVSGGKWYTDSYDGRHLQGFYDEWDFHRVLQQRTSAVTDGEAREYRRRRASTLQQFEVVLDDIKCKFADAYEAGGCGAATPTAIGKVHPGDAQMWEGDPFVANAYLGSIDSKMFVSPPALQGNLVAIGGQLVPGAFTQEQLLSGQILTGAQLVPFQASVSTTVSNTARLSLLAQNFNVGSQLQSLNQLLGQGSIAAQLGSGLGNVFGGLGNTFGNGANFKTPQAPAGGGVAGLAATADTAATNGVTLDAAMLTESRALYGEELTRLNAPTGDAAVGGGPGITPPPEPPHFDPATLVKFGNLAWFMETVWTTNPPKIDASKPYPHLDCTVPGRIIIGDDRAGGVALDGRDTGGAGLADDAMHTRTAWKDVCAMTNLIFEEWGRKLTGVPSCYDKASYACDWEPQDFVDRYVTRNVNFASAAKEVEYKWCKKWTGGGKVSDAAHPGLWVPPSERTTLPKFRAYLKKRQDEFEKIFKTVPVKLVDDFGTMRSDSNHIGDDLFGGGYSYDLGWHAKVYQRTKTDNQICRLGGAATAKFNADAIIFGGTANLIDASAVVSSNEGDSGEAKGNTHLYVVGYEIFDTGDVDLSGAWSDSTFNGGKPELFSVPFQAGPVTITVTVGLSYDYGVMATLIASSPKPTDCSPNAPLYSAKATFVPFADLGVWADADASLAGVVGVGLEVQLTLVGLQLPLIAHADLVVDNQNDLAILFNASLDLDLHTLDGEIDLYIKALFMKVASFTLVKWPGFHHKFPIFRTPTASLKLGLMLDAVQPPESSSGSEAL